MIKLNNLKMNFNKYIYKFKIKIFYNFKKNLIFKIFNKFKEELIIIKDQIKYKY